MKKEKAKVRKRKKQPNDENVPPTEEPVVKKPLG